MSKFDKDSVFDDFKLEIYKYIDKIHEKLDILEQNIHNSEALEEILRAAHTIKGSSAVMNYEYINNLTSTVELILENIKSENLQLNERIVGLLKDANDGLKIMVSNVEGDIADINKSIWEELGPVLEELTQIPPPQKEQSSETIQDDFDNEEDKRALKILR